MSSTPSVLMSQKRYPKHRQQYHFTTIFFKWENSYSAIMSILCCFHKRYYHMARVSCQKCPTRHAYAWQIGSFSQDTLDECITHWHAAHVSYHIGDEVTLQLTGLWHHLPTTWYYTSNHGFRKAKNIYPLVDSLNRLTLQWYEMYICNWLTKIPFCVKVAEFCCKRH